VERDLKTLANNITDDYFQEAYKLLAGGRTVSVAGDTVYQHSLRDLEELSQLTYTHIQARHIEAGIKFHTLDQVRSDVKMKLTGDEFYNPATGIGTFNDPQLVTRSNIPVMMGPMEQTSIYANGGISAMIIDKKTKGLVQSGVTFESRDKDFWNFDRVQELEDGAESSGLNPILIEALRDTLLHGGAFIYPVMKKGGVSNFGRPVDKLVEEKDCIERWITVDRWNMVFIPSYIVTAKDYINPDSVYIPYGGYDVSTHLGAVLRPKSMPFWAVMYNMGFSPGDYCGYIRALEAYQMVVASIPIMAQQMSLVLYRVPLDALNAQLTPKTVDKIQSVNERSLREWSVLNPKVVNMIGEVSTIERTFAGFDNFFGAIKNDLATQCGITEPVLWHTPNKGFQDVTASALLKDSENMKILANGFTTQLKNIKDLVVAHTYGTSSEEWQKRGTLRLSFDRPVMSSEKDQGEIGARFAASVASLASAGIPAHVAVEIVEQFFKSVNVTEEELSEIKELEDFNKQIEKDSAQQKKLGQGMGHTLASKGNSGNAGKLAKPK